MWALYVLLALHQGIVDGIQVYVRRLPRVYWSCLDGIRLTVAPEV